MLGGVGEQNKVNVFSFSFFLSLSPPLSLFPFLSVNADGYRVPLIQASSRQRIQGGRRGNALRTRRYVGSTRELCNLVTY